jgi:hypothetical protein
MKLSVGLLGVAGLLFSCADYSQLNNAPLPAGTLSVASVQDSTVTLVWSQCNNVNFRSYKVYWDTNSEVDMASTFVDSLLFAQDTQQVVPGLRSGTNYYFRVILTSQAGYMTPSNIVRAVTWLAFYPQLQLGDTAVQLQWTSLKKWPFTGYSLYSDTGDGVDSASPLWAQLVSTDTALNVKNILAGTTRYFKVYAAGSGGYLTTSAAFPVVGWWFKQYAPQQVADTAVEIMWSRVNAGVQCYLIFRNATTPVDTTDTLCATVASGDTSATIGNLQSGAPYAFRVYARNTSAYFGWTDPMQISLTTSFAKRVAE